VWNCTFKKTLPLVRSHGNNILAMFACFAKKIISSKTSIALAGVEPE